MNVFIPPELYETIKALANFKGLTEVETLKRAIAIDLFFTDSIRNGKTVMMLDKDGDIKEVQFN